MTLSNSHKQHDDMSLFERITKIVMNENQLQTQIIGTRISDTEFRIPRFDDYRMMIVHNYTLTQLKIIARSYKQKLTGNKPSLVVRIFEYLYYSVNARTIQALHRRRIVNKYIRSKGPAFTERINCLNEYDFLTMDELTKIKSAQFFSFKDTSGFNYGFDAVSMHNLIHKSAQNQERMGEPVVKNPYTNEPLPETAIGAFKTMMRLSKILKIQMCVSMDGETKQQTIVSVPAPQLISVEARVRNIFHAIDDLGNFSNMQWFLTLTPMSLGYLYRELLDIWVYRANLSMRVKRNICPPVGNPFEGQVRANTVQVMRINDARTTMANIMEKFIGGVDADSRYIGAQYVLGALTLVSIDAANALPWLYHAMTYN